MFVLDAKTDRLVALALAVLMAATRVHHFGVGAIAPDASTAAFLLAGLLLGSPYWLLALMAEATLLDLFAIKMIGVEAVCVTTGYGLMFPAYAMLWLAGRSQRQAPALDFLTGAKLVGATVAGTAGFFLFSNIGYYIGGGFADQMGASEYATRVARYFPFYLMVTLAYGAAGVALVALVRRSQPTPVSAR
ncbi:MAG TPA: DUF6580 family putative transport protein [Xanthobacteraceae bacterium]|nr:DUF6580 family putative transport protein [Xanthobacteraceae bacterium]